MCNVGKKLVALESWIFGIYTPDTLLVKNIWYEF